MRLEVAGMLKMQAGMDPQTEHDRLCCAKRRRGRLRVAMGRKHLQASRAFAKYLRCGGLRYHASWCELSWPGEVDRARHSEAF